MTLGATDFYKKTSKFGTCRIIKLIDNNFFHIIYYQQSQIAPIIKEWEIKLDFMQFFYERYGYFVGREIW